MVVITHIELASDGNGPPIFSIPPHGFKDNPHPIRIIQQGVGSNITPGGIFCYHISMVQTFKDRDDFSVLTELKNTLFNLKSTKSSKILGKIKPKDNTSRIHKHMDEIVERRKQEKARQKRMKQKQKERKMKQNQVDMSDEDAMMQVCWYSLTLFKCIGSH